MLLQLIDIKKSYGGTAVLCNVCTRLNKGDRIAIIGKNGAGKTTLLRILTGEVNSDYGEVQIAVGSRIGYLAQHNDFLPQSTVFEEMQSAFAFVKTALDDMRRIETELITDPNNSELHKAHDEAERIVLAADYYTADTRIKKLLSGFGFPFELYKQNTSTLSGGEATRLRLAKLLLTAPDILLLDEPTNHLDFTTLNFLEQELNIFKGAIIAVTHDRTFIDNICGSVWELEQGALTEYPGNFNNYFELKAAAIEQQQNRHETDIKTAQKLTDYIARNKARASTANMAKSREKQLQKLNITKKPSVAKNKLKINFDFTKEPYKDVLICKDLSVAIEKKTLIKHLCLEMTKGQKIIIAGENGSGKSTLLNVLTHKLLPIDGTTYFGSGVQLSVFLQQQQKHPGQVIDVIRRLRPRFTEQETRDLLAKFLFCGEDVFADCQTLSGGEAARLRLAEITLEQPNFIIMDEPSNHLDVFTRESLCRGLCDYKGSLLIVSHDRYLMSKLACQILYISNLKAVMYNNFTALMSSIGVTTPEQKLPPKTAGKGKADERKKRTELRLQKSAIEGDIDMYEAKIKELNKELEDPCISADHIRLTDIVNQLEEIKQALEKAYDCWEILEERGTMKNADF